MTTIKLGEFEVSLLYLVNGKHYSSICPNCGAPIKKLIKKRKTVLCKKCAVLNGNKKRWANYHKNNGGQK